MNTSALLKLAPTLIMAAVMAYAAYSIEPARPASPQPQPGEAKSTSARPGSNTAGAAATAAPGGPSGARRRNPFVAIVQPTRKAGGKLAGTVAAPVDPFATFVGNLTLNATFIQGHTRYASINGRLYRQGQPLESSDGKALAFILADVTPNQATLEANGKRYALAYPSRFMATARSRGGARAGAAPPRSAAGSSARTGRWRSDRRSRAARVLQQD